MTGSLYPVTQADIDAWEILGPAIFHGDMTGPEALAEHRLTSQTETPSRDALTDPMTEAAGGQVAVTQEDREAADAWYDGPAQQTLLGLRNSLADAFAAHRLATRPTPSDALVEALELIATLWNRACAAGLHDHVDRLDDDDEVLSSILAHHLNQLPRILRGALGDDAYYAVAVPARQALAATIPADDGKGEVEAKAKELYVDYTDNDPVVHCNRFPAWSELSEPVKVDWRAKALAAPRPTGDEKP